MDDDDFTFPTVAATAPEGQSGRRGDDQVPVPRLLPLPLPNLAAASPLWPFAGSLPKTTTATAGNQQEEEGDRVAADEDRMDLLWEEDTTTTRPAIETTAPAPESRRVAVGPHAGPPPKQRAAAADVDDDDDKQRAAALADAERMDKLWESFNEDLVLRHHHRGRDRGRRRTKSAADHPGISIKVSRASAGGLGDPADDDHWYLCNYSPSSGADDESDQETSASSPAERRVYGCAPTMLRASSRAGGAGQLCAASSPRGRRRRGARGAAAGWALLLRLFRRLFAVDRTAPSPSRSHSSIYVP